MNSKAEIYWVKFNKYKLGNGDVGFAQYCIGTPLYIESDITPVKITKIKDRIVVNFSDGGKHEFGYNEDVELFYRPIKKDDGGTIKN